MPKLILPKNPWRLTKKINLVNNLSKFSININNDNNSYKNNVNENKQTKIDNINKSVNKNQIYEQITEENIKINHDYSNDDILQNTDSSFSSNEKEKEKSNLIANLINKTNTKIKINDERNKNKENRNFYCFKYCNNKLLKDKTLDKNDYNLNKNREKIELKRNIEKNSDEINCIKNNNYIKEKNFKTINHSNDEKSNIDDKIPQKKKNSFNLHYTNNNKNILFKDNKKNKINHRILCHKFTDNPQHFYTAKLTQSMIKQLIKVKIKSK